MSFQARLASPDHIVLTGGSSFDVRQALTVCHQTNDERLMWSEVHKGFSCHISRAAWVIQTLHSKFVHVRVLPEAKAAMEDQAWVKSTAR